MKGEKYYNRYIQYTEISYYHSEQLCTTKLENLEEMEEFLI